MFEGPTQPGSHDRGLVAGPPRAAGGRPGRRLGDGAAAVSSARKEAAARIAGLKVTESVCPYCAVGCGQVVYTRDGELVDIEGNPRSPINQGTLCPKGSASRQLVQQPGRLTKVSYRRPGGTEWEELELEQAMDMIAERVIAARENGWQDTDADGWRVDRTLGFAHLGGATLDNEENYLIKKTLHRDGRGPDREPGPHMTLLHGPRSGDLVRARRRHHVPAGPPARRLHPDRGLVDGRGAPGRLPLGDEGQGARRASSSTSTRASPARARWPTSTSRSAPAPTSRSSAG